MDQNQRTYTIDVFGKKPGVIQVGTINKRSGQPEAGAMEAIQEVGEINIPNYSRVWGIQEKDKKTGKLTGKVEALPWEADKDGAGIIEIRYLRNCESISVDYQKEKGLYVKTANGEFIVKKEDAEITLKYGLNKFTEPADKVLIMFLKLHSYNLSNGSRNPENRHVRFKTHASEEIVSKTADDVLLRHQTEGIVLDAKNKPSNLKVLAILFDEDTNEPDDSKIFNRLLHKASNPTWFLGILKAKAQDYKDVIVGAVSAELLDLNDVSGEGNAYIMIGGDKQIFITSVEGDNIDQRIEYITDNITRAEYYHALNRLVEEYKKFKDLVLE